VILHTLGANFVKPKHVGRHFCRIFRKFAQIFWGFAKVFTDRFGLDISKIVSSARGLVIQLDASGKSLIKTINTRGPSVDP